MRKVCAALRLVSGLLSFDHDIPHECKMAHPYLVLTIVDILNLRRSGFVLTFDFLELVWGKVRSHCFDMVYRITSLKNLMPFLQRLPL